jgi:hypothetical protein
MTANIVDRQVEFSTALTVPARSPDIPESADAYGWLVGSWELDVLHYWAHNVAAQGIKAEAHFAWVLDGLAVQDVWIMPRRTDRTAPLEKSRNMFGTTLRVWDPAIEAWRISWRNPAGDHHEDQIGRRIGNDIVQLGTRPNGAATRWTFTDITPNAFHWLGESLNPDGKTWTLEGEFRAKRTR